MQKIIILKYAYMLFGPGIPLVAIDLRILWMVAWMRVFTVALVVEAVSHPGVHSEGVDMWSVAGYHGNRSSLRINDWDVRTAWGGGVLSHRPSKNEQKKKGRSHYTSDSQTLVSRSLSTLKNYQRPQKAIVYVGYFYLYLSY